jgi:hypothetical protein
MVTIDESFDDFENDENDDIDDNSTRYGFCELCGGPLFCDDLEFALNRHLECDYEATHNAEEFFKKTI